MSIEDFGDDEDTSAGQEQELTVTAKASQAYSTTSKTVKINVLPKPPAKGRGKK